MVADLTSASPAVIGKKRATWVIASLQLMLLLSAIDQTIIATAMPKIITALGGFDRYTWSTTAYLLTSTISIPIIGRISDMLGRKKLLLSGVVAFIITSLICGVAGLSGTGSVFGMDPMGQFIAARAVQGIGGGLIVGLAFTIVGDMFSPAERGKYQGHFAAVFAISSVLGPTLGGIVADQYSWRWLFYSNLPIGLAAMALFIWAFPSDEKKADTILDIPGILYFAVGMTSYLLGMSAVAAFGWASLQFAVCMAVAIFCSVQFFNSERKAQEPFIPLPFFKNKLVAISCMSVFTTGIGLFGSTLILPLIFQSIFGMGVSRSGMFMSPLIIAVAITSIAGGAWMSKAKKYKAICLVSLALMAVGTLAIYFTLPTLQMTPLLVEMALVATGLGLVLPVYTVVIQNAVEQQHIGAVTGFSQFFRSVGGTTGVTALGSLLTYLYRTKLTALLPTASAATRNILFNPLEPAKMRAALTATGLAVDKVDLACAATQQTLVATIGTTTLIYGVLLVAIFLLNLRLEEKPLRETTR